MVRVVVLFCVLLVLVTVNADLFGFFNLRTRPTFIDSRKLTTRTYSVFGNNNPALRLVRRFGYPIEAHEIRTEDGYILTVHRIPYGNTVSTKKNVGRPPVLLHHGLVASSDSWILRGPDKDLAFILADNGYDVWISNARGNYYSRKHVSLDPDRDKHFWDFSFHEIGYYDLPATIDYMLERTNQSSIFYTGHSMGATVFFVLCTMRPEYNRKIRLMQGLAPAVYIVHKPSPFLKFILSNTPQIEETLKTQGVYEIFPLRKFNSRIGRALCDSRALTQPLCLAGIFVVAGIDYQQLNTSLVPLIFEHFPAGGSVNQFVHFYQNIVNGAFRAMDYGTEGNVKRYRRKDAPDYDLRKVTTPVSLHYGDGDYIIKREDTELLSSKLPNVVGTFRVPFKYFNHVDFLWSSDSKMLLYEQLLTIMQKYR